MSLLNLYQDIYVACALCRHDVDFHICLGLNGGSYEVMKCIFPTDDDIRGPDWPDCNCEYYYDCIEEEDGGEEDTACRV